MKQMLASVGFVLVCSAVVAEVDPEYEDGHLVLYFKGSGNPWSNTDWYYDAAFSSSARNFEDDAIADFKSGNVGFAKGVTNRIYQIRWNKNAYFGNQGGYGGCDLGAGGMIVGSEMNGWLQFANRWNLAATQVWTNWVGTSGKVNMTIEPNQYWTYPKNPFVLTAEDGVALKVAGNLTWNFRAQAALTNNDVTIISPAKLNVTYIGEEEAEAASRSSATHAGWPTNAYPQYTAFNARKLTLDGSASTLVSAYGHPCFLAKTVAVNNGGSLTVNSGKSVGLALDDFADTLTSEAGAGSLLGVVAASAEPFPLVAEDGATLTVGCKFVGEEPVRLALSGAGTVVINSTGLAPEIASAEGFTGTLELKKLVTFAEGVLENFPGQIRVTDNVTFTVAYPDLFDLSAFTVAAGKTATLRYATPRPPAAYLNGYALATGVTEEAKTNGWSFTLYHDDEKSDDRKPDMSFSIVDNTLRVDPNVPPLELSVVTTAASTIWENKIWKWPDGTMGYWRDGAIATLQAGKNTAFYDKAIVIGGLRWHESFSSFFQGSGLKMYLGAGGIEYTGGSGIRFWTLKELRLIASQTWKGVSGAVYLGDNSSTYKMYYPTLVTADEDVVLTLEGPYTTAVNCTCDFSQSDIVLKGAQTSGKTTLTIDNNKWGLTDIALNARTLTVRGNSKVLVQSDFRPDGGRTVAQKVVFDTDANGTAQLAFDKTAAGAIPGFDVGAIEVSGTAGEAELTGSCYLLDGTVPVTIAAGSTLACNATFANATERPGAFALSGAGTWKMGTTAAQSAPVLTAASLQDFDGTVAVAAGGVLRLSGAVDFPALTFLGDATVCLDLSRGDKIVDWSKVTFPASGSVTLRISRDEAIAPAEGTIDLGQSFAGVSAEDRAKIKIVVAEPHPSNSYKITAMPRYDADGNLSADLSAKITVKVNSDGQMVWLGKDWGDATDVRNWARLENGVDPATFDPTKHPASLSDLQNLTANHGIYSSKDWRLDLKGETFSCSTARSNGDATSPHWFGVSNGTFNARVVMLGRGGLNVEYGATFKATGAVDKYWFAGTQSTPANQFLFRVHGNASAEFDGDLDRGMREYLGELYSARYLVDEGGLLSYHPTTMPYVNNHKATFENHGVMTFPRGFTATSEMTAASSTGAVEIVQRAGTLHLAGAFVQRGPDESQATTFADLRLEGGTTVLSNGVSFADWNLAVAEGAAFALEIPKGGDFTTDVLTFGEGFALEKKGEGVLRFAVTNEVAAGSVTVSGGALAGAAPMNVGTLDVVLAGGALAADPDTADVLAVTNGTVSATGGWKVRTLVPFTGTTTAIPFLTVAAAADPQLTDADVTFLNARGKPVNGKLAKEDVLVGDVPCVRYSASFSGVGTLLIVR